MGRFIKSVNFERNGKMATIIEALGSADRNLSNKAIPPQMKEVGLSQLHNCVELLEKGYGLNEEVEPLLEKEGDVDSVPDINED